MRLTEISNGLTASHHAKPCIGLQHRYKTLGGPPCPCGESGLLWGCCITTHGPQGRESPMPSAPDCILMASYGWWKWKWCLIRTHVCGTKADRGVGRARYWQAWSHWGNPMPLPRLAMSGYPETYGSAMWNGQVTGWCHQGSSKSRPQLQNAEAREWPWFLWGVKSPDANENKAWFATVAKFMPGEGPRYAVIECTGYLQVAV